MVTGDSRQIDEKLLVRQQTMKQFNIGGYNE
jgi:hypothetical protein